MFPARHPGGGSGGGGGGGVEGSRVLLRSDKFESSHSLQPVQYYGGPTAVSTKPNNVANVATLPTVAMCEMAARCTV